ncbi:hypothetical protein BYT27DRAFT_6900984 [Phlegmacium glaucopus]|nr:hypothetical protein BYT27DRAFT_6900984 [Phlegmacium glaucopus]
MEEGQSIRCRKEIELWSFRLVWTGKSTWQVRPTPSSPHFHALYLTLLCSSDRGHRNATAGAGVGPDSAVLTIDASLVACSSQIPEFAKKTFVDSPLPVLVSSAGGSRGRAKSVSVGLRKEPTIGLHTKTEASYTYTLRFKNFRLYIYFHFTI